MIRDILKYGDPRLLSSNREVTEFGSGLVDLVRDLVETCRAAPGLGLAAPQIGVNEQVAIVDLSGGKEEGAAIVLVNPAVVAAEGEDRDTEGCLSLPGLRRPLTRPKRVVVEAEDLRGVRRSIEGSGLLARALSHETDHLRGVLFLDHLRGLEKEIAYRRAEKRFRAGVR